MLAHRSRNRTTKKMAVPDATTSHHRRAKRDATAIGTARIRSSGTLSVLSGSGWVAWASSMERTNDDSPQTSSGDHTAAAVARKAAIVAAPPNPNAAGAHANAYGLYAPA